MLPHRFHKISIFRSNFSVYFDGQIYNGFLDLGINFQRVEHTYVQYFFYFMNARDKLTKLTFVFYY